MILRKAVLCVAGLDPSGGAGLAQDLRVVREQCLHPAGVCAAVTAQSPSGVTWQLPVPAEGLRAQILAVLEALPVAAVKVGMLGRAEAAPALCEALWERPDLPVVWDPVLQASAGGSLLAGDLAALAPLRARATLVTPNLPELAALIGEARPRATPRNGPSGDGAWDPDGMERGARALLAQGSPAVLVTGGHLPGGPVDVLVTSAGAERFEGTRIGPGDVRGTGCALSTAIACRLALGDDLREAVIRARADLRRRLSESYDLGGADRYLG